MPITVLLRMSLSERTDMKRMMMWGMPKYPRPQPRPERMSFQSVISVQ